MSAMLPLLLGTLGGAALVTAVFLLWRSLRAAFGIASLESVQNVSESERRAGFLDEKKALLESIRDLAFERDVDKIAEADFEKLDATLRGRVRDVMKSLDEDVQAFRGEAERLVAERLKKLTDTPYRSALAIEDERAAPRSSTDARPVDRTCAACGTRNDTDASFCKKCGKTLSDEEPEASDEEGIE